MNKDSQKGILIGKGGDAIKALGIVAREKLEEVPYCTCNDSGKCVL